MKKLILLLNIFFTLSLFGQQNDKISLVLSYPTNPVKDFKGFGVEWDSRAYDENGVTEEDFKIIGERIKYMQIPIVRIMMLTKWCYSESIGYNWNSKEMKTLYRHLQFCNENEIEVMITDWGIEVDWNAVDGISKTDDAKYADVIGTYLDYLINEKGFSCIKYFGLVNEPNYEVGDFERWRRGAENLFQVFKDKELDKKVKLVGPGQSGSNQWFIDTVDEARYIFDIYDVHMYAWQDRTAIGSVQLELAELWNYAKSLDQNWNSKIYFVTEAGMRDGQSASISTKINDFYYGVFMVDFAIQALHSSANAVLAWMLDDNSHPNFEWGLWKDKKNGLQLRPWFYSWALLTKFFPAGSEVFKVRSRSINIRALASKIISNGKVNWSFVIVNVSPEKQSVLLKVDQQGEFKLDRYIYEENSIKKDESGFPVHNQRDSVNLHTGFEFEIPAKSVIFFTSLENTH